MKATKIKDILRRRDSKLSMNEISQLTGVSKGSVINVMKRAVKATVDGEKAQQLPDEELEALLYPERLNIDMAGEPDFEALREEMAKPEVNAQLLWHEYREQNPEGLKRSTFYNRLGLAGTPDLPCPNMHQDAKGGEKLMIDYSGVKASYTDAQSGIIIEVELFVANWMASSFLYVEASPSQGIEDWIASNVRALRFFGCAPTYLVPDNLKSGIDKANFYDPTVNRAYAEFAKHYGCAVLPARARRPKDKASVESNVKFVQIHILGRLRNRKFGSLSELNEAIRECLAEVNRQVMQRFRTSRVERFEKIDRPYAQELPSTDFFVHEIKDHVRVGDDHHVPFNGHFYSVPWRLTGAYVDIWRCGEELYLYYDHERVASHPISKIQGHYTTNDAHRPPNHLFMRNLNPLWMLKEAEKIGPTTHEFLRNMIAADARHCEVPVRKGLGIIDLTRDYPVQRVDVAVGWAIHHGMTRIHDIRTILEQGLENTVLGCPHLNKKSPIPPEHGNIRGPGHYNNIYNNI